VLRKAISELPKEQLGSGSDAPEKPRDPNAFPTTREQTSTCPGGCHAPNRSDAAHSLIAPGAESEADRRAIAAWVAKPQTKPAAPAGAAHTAPPGEHPPAAGLQSFPSPQGQQGDVCPNCHKTPESRGVMDKFGGLGFGPNSQLSDADRKALLDFINAQK
jgi:hypothetical protein